MQIKVGQFWYIKKECEWNKMYPKQILINDINNKIEWSKEKTYLVYYNKVRGQYLTSSQFKESEIFRNYKLINFEYTFFPEMNRRFEKII